MKSSALALTTVAALGLSLSALPAHAASATDYDVLVFGSATVTNSDAEGTVAVGGAFNATNYGVGSALPSSFTATA